MDHVIVNYLRSGRAWVLVGSGPSTAKGYPTWQALADAAVKLIRANTTSSDLTHLNAAMIAKRYPAVFEEAARILGMPTLVQGLRVELRAHQGGDSEAYQLLAKWPVPVYLTTNFDDELHEHLASVREAYNVLHNSPEDIGELLPESSRLVVKLHGDLRSPDGLILRTSDYAAISESANWQYWRTKMTSVFQMQRVIIVGHSLSDPNVRHILEAAKQGAKVNQPVCWIAPDVSDEQIRQMTEQFRLHVLTYDNSDSSHRNLTRMLRKLTDFVPDRTTIRVRREIAAVGDSVTANTAATGFFVFNAASSQGDFDSRRINVIAAAAMAGVTDDNTTKTFTLTDLLQRAGWPAGEVLADSTATAVTGKLVRDGLVEPVGDKYRLTNAAFRTRANNRQSFDAAKSGFLRAVELRVQREFPQIHGKGAQRIASDLERSLTGFFREGGLTLASILFRDPGHATTALPPSILRFIKDTASRYDTHLDRQAFITVAIDAFVRAEDAERTFLAHVSRGFFNFHALGTFGEAARERVEHARSTVWLIDSDTLIPALAPGHPTHRAARDVFGRLRAGAIRLFTTERLFEETFTHLWFAVNLVRKYGEHSMMIAASANGESPFFKSNAFLEGFIKSRAANVTTDFRGYMHASFGTFEPRQPDVRRTLESLGIEIVGFNTWPGFQQGDYEIRDGYTTEIARFSPRTTEGELSEEALRKAEPEAEALVVVEQERAGRYRMLREEASGAWFITHTSVLNRVGNASRRTWRPEAFLSFASTLSPRSDAGGTEEAFEPLLWNLSESGVSVIADDVIETAFSSVIDEAELNVEQLRNAYDETLATKYGTPLDTLIESIAPRDRPEAALQLANEIIERERRMRAAAEERERAQAQRAVAAEARLREVAKLAKKLDAKKNDGGRRRRQIRGKRNRSGRGKGKGKRK